MGWNPIKAVGKLVKGAHAKPVNQVRAQQGKSQINPDNFRFDAGNWANGLAKVGGATLLGSTIIPAMAGGAGGAGGAAGTAANAGGFMGGLKSVGKFALDHGDAILGGIGAYEGMKDDKASRDMMNRAIAEQQRRQQMAGVAADKLMGLQRPDLSSLYSDPANPYARKRIPAVGMGA